MKRIQFPPATFVKLDGMYSERQLETSRPVAKCNFYVVHLHLVPPLGVIPSEFHRDLWHHKTRVHELSCGIVFTILLLAILVQLSTCDRRMDRHAMIANTVLAYRQMGHKKVQFYVSVGNK